MRKILALVLARSAKHLFGTISAANASLRLRCRCRLGRGYETLFLLVLLAVLEGVFFFLTRYVGGDGDVAPAAQTTLERASIAELHGGFGLASKS